MEHLGMWKWNDIFKDKELNTPSTESMNRVIIRKMVSSNGLYKNIQNEKPAEHVY